MCGKVAFEIRGPFRGFQYCHCSRCRNGRAAAGRVSHFRLKLSMQNLFALPKGLVVMAIPRKSGNPFWSGGHLGPSLMPVVRAQREHWVRLPSGWDCYELMVSEELIQREGLLPPELLAETARLELS